jgi:hypothetical protein
MSALLIVGVSFMPQAADKTDREFVSALRTSISGIYYRQVERYSNAKIIFEYRKAVQDKELLSDDVFMQNLHFLVRKREIVELRGDIAHVVSSNKLKPASQVSALKTLFAIGKEDDRKAIDDTLSQALSALAESGRSDDTSPYIVAADRVGGPKTLAVLHRLLKDAENRQRANEQQSTSEPEYIGQLDKFRSTLDSKLFALRQKLEILAKPQPERTADLARAYLQRSPELSCWSRKLLLGQSFPEGAGIVRNLINHEIPSFLPPAGLEPRERAQLQLDLKLRGLAILQDMQSTLEPQEEQLLHDNRQLIQSREPFFHPRCDWEDILDEV